MNMHWHLVNMNKNIDLDTELMLKCLVSNDIDMETIISVSVPHNCFLDEFDRHGPLRHACARVKSVIQALNNNRTVYFDNKQDKENVFLLIKKYNLLVDELSKQDAELTYRRANVAELRLQDDISIDLALRNDTTKEFNELDLEDVPDSLQEKLDSLEAKKSMIKKKDPSNLPIYKRPRLKMHDAFKETKAVDNTDMISKFNNINIDV